ncbi:MAG: methyltransferase [Candidatus Marinimicrobia bacterium]|jgi:ribosomal protein L11 methyltransferase|nr:methyltransferase [Candidatus Neomarinimicrobiota bacterium]MBT3635096.1 methyltransferase [Candidatus Neomarinimicrobiota bacterium]MBT3683956.1 methyltransferase [Candidatus Neomarinimicrobiota bacterium]MBT3760683.1 methyltransferase [Candidatus Neomarinimicrobiota bacterium]MBT3896799.1 methyltransferase [Candidatus Neomarinimicrobiota bacterium]
MTIPQDKWDVLTLVTDQYTREIVSSHFMMDCLGAYDNGQKGNYYFTNGRKENVDKYLKELSGSFTFTWSWYVQAHEDWHLAWKDSFTPILFGEKLAIVPDWETKKLADIQIRIQPGNAFGTGHHETTSLIIKHLMEHIIPHCSVLDVGTGSGILAIAAKKLGAGTVTCIEYDRDCQTNFETNIRLNKLDGKLKFIHQDALQWMDYSQDIILINVNRHIILDLLPRLKKSTGLILLTGILQEDLKLVESECKKNGIIIENVATSGEWICLTVLAREN